MRIKTMAELQKCLGEHVRPSSARVPEEFRFDFRNPLLTKPKGARVGRTPKVKADNARFEDLLAFQMRSVGLPTPERQYPFARSLKRQFLADFAFVPYSLLVEVNGGIWRKGGGAHSHPSNIERDVEKQQCAVLLGFYLLPVTTDEVTSGKAVDIVQQALVSKGWHRESAS